MIIIHNMDSVFIETYYDRYKNFKLELDGAELENTLKNKLTGNQM